MRIKLGFSTCDVGGQPAASLFCSQTSGDALSCGQDLNHTTHKKRGKNHVSKSLIFFQN